MGIVSFSFSSFCLSEMSTFPVQSPPLYSFGWLQRRQTKPGGLEKR